MKKRYFPYERFIVRRPLKNYDGHMFTSEEFEKIITQEDFQEALYYASPDLYDELKKYLGGRLPDGESKRMIATLYKYAQRIHYRCTPIGMFAFCSVGKYSDNTAIPNDKCVGKHYRYDCKFLFDYINYLLKNADSKLIESLNVCTNQTVVSIKSRFHLSVQGDNGRIIDIKLPKNELLDFIMSVSKNALSCRELIKQTLDMFEMSYPDCVDYIKRLILIGVLLPDIKISTTGEDNFKRIYRLLKNSNPILLEDLDRLITLLNSDQSFDVKRNEIEALINKAHSIGLDIKRNMFLQIDSFSNEHVYIDESVNKQIIEWFKVLTRISLPSENPLRGFISRYAARYENMSKPVLEVLDHYIGIEYKGNTAMSSDLLRNIFSRSGIEKKAAKIFSYSLTVIEQIVLNKLLEKGNIMEKSVRLTKSDFPSDDYFMDEDYFASYNCMFKIVGYNDNGSILSNLTFSGPSASCLITRFADSLVEIKDILEEISEREQHALPDIILAEISHLSNPHSGNVQIRPSFRPYEIPYLSFKKDDDIKTLHLDDLVINIIGGRVKLMSKKYNKEVVPCYSSAFNYKRLTSELYQFLGDIQLQKAARGLSANFYTLLTMLKHVPRIVYKNIMVNPESWQIENFWKRKQSTDSVEQFRSMHSFLKMSRYLSFYQGDNYFIIDVESDLSILEFFRLSKTQERVVLSEFLAMSDDFQHYKTILEIVQPFLLDTE